MTPSEKAKELYFKMMEHAFGGDSEQSKQCALIAVDEIIDILGRVSAIDSNHFRLTSSGNYGDSEIELKFWQEVKEEITKL